MAPATRLQIEATHASPKYRVEILVPGVGYTQVLDARVADISGSIDSTSNSDNALSFGSPSEPSASVTAEDYTFSGKLLSDAYWIGKTVRVSFGFDTSDYEAIFIGPINSIRKNNETVQYDLGGSQNYLRDDIKLVTPLYYRKPIATATSVATQENPDSPGYVAGIINYVFWRSGGRPYEQKGILYNDTDPDFNFWYTCDQSLIAPDYSWLSGENSIDEVYTLARAAGGQIYQDLNGVLHYTQPLMFGENTAYAGSYYTFTDSVFDGYQESISSNEKVGTLKLTYTPRKVQPTQVVIEDNTAKFFAPGETKIIELSPSLPIWQYIGLTANNQSTAKVMVAALLTGALVDPIIGPISQNASRVTITVTNPSISVSMVLYSIKIEGRPLAAEDELFVSYGSGSPERNVENNVYIQNESHAYRIIRMIYDFYNEAKPIVTLSNVQFDLDRYVGELVKINSRYRNDGAVYRITKIDYNLGTTMNIDLVKVTNLPKRSNMFIIGTTYTSGTVKKLSY